MNRGQQQLDFGDEFKDIHRHGDGRKQEKKFNEVIRNTEGWSKKYKDSINCSHPKGFSQKAHCAGKKKKVKEYGVPDYNTMPTYKLKKASKGKQKFFLPSNEPTPKGVLAIENFSKPQFDVEWNEANRYPFIIKFGIDVLIELAQTGKVANINSDSVKKIGNTGADGSETFDDLNPDKVARFTQAQKSGTIEMPIVMKMPNGKLELIAGNTRLIGLMNSTGTAKVWYIDASKLNEDATKGNFGGLIYPKLPHEEVLNAISSWEYRDTPIELSNGYVINAREEGYNADDNAWVLLDPQGKIVDHGEGSIEGVMQDFTPIAIEENFADGKKKGKSRPGRVKRSGASCKGLLPQEPKVFSERGKMYWCTNMNRKKKSK